MIEVGVQPDRVVFLEHVHQFRCDALRQHDRGARADADDLHVGNGTQTADDIFEFFVAHQQGVAAREQHVAYLRCTGDVVDAVVDLFLGGCTVVLAGEAAARAVTAVHRAHVGNQEQYPVGVTVRQTRYGRVAVLMQGIFQVGGRALQLLDGRNGLLADRAVRIFRIDQRQVVGRDGHAERFERFADAFLLFSGQLDVFLELIYGLNPVFYLPVPVVPLLVGHFGKEFFSAAHCGCERCHLILFVSFGCYVVAICVFSPM